MISYAAFFRRDLTNKESSLDDKLPELVALHGNKTGVPLNFLHVVLGRDAFPSVTDRSLFYNTDAELKKAMKQSQDGVGFVDPVFLGTS